MTSCPPSLATVPCSGRHLARPALEEPFPELSKKPPRASLPRASLAHTSQQPDVFGSTAPRLEATELSCVCKEDEKRSISNLREVESTAPHSQVAKRIDHRRGVPQQGGGPGQLPPKGYLESSIDSGRAKRKEGAGVPSADAHRNAARSLVSLRPVGPEL
ncbi:hypothetical protein ABZP36_004965 [Zizania latifolia]